MTTAAKVAIEKREHPERFCEAPGCLWRVKHLRGGPDTPCKKHMLGRTRLNDVVLWNDGSITLVLPLTDGAREWLEENTDGQWFGDALAVEHRYVADLRAGLIEAGFKVA